MLTTLLDWYITLITSTLCVLSEGLRNLGLCSTNCSSSSSLSLNYLKSHHSLNDANLLALLMGLLINADKILILSSLIRQQQPSIFYGEENNFLWLYVP